jgi:hypothetical protein
MVTRELRHNPEFFPWDRTGRDRDGDQDGDQAFIGDDLNQGLFAERLWRQTVIRAPVTQAGLEARRDNFPVHRTSCSKFSVLLLCFVQSTL